MKFYIVLLLFINICSVCHAQQPIKDSAGFIIINSEKLITNDRLFEPPLPKNKKPLYFINGKEVYCLSYYYNHDEFKKITVLERAAGIAKYGRKAKNGVVLLELNDDVTKPIIEITSNRVYYTCEVNGRTVDTSAAYFKAVNGNGCSILDLAESVHEPVLYIGFDNIIRIRHLGVGWDMVALYIAGGMMSGTGGERIIRVKNKGTVRLGITTGDKITELVIKVIPLPDRR